MDDGGAPFTSLASGSCEITVTSSLSGLLPNTKYAARWTTSGAGNTGCINNTPTATSRSFSVVKFLKDHAFTIYFKDPQTVGTTFQLSVTFKP